MKRIFENLWKDDRGNALAIFAAALAPLVLIIGCGVDLSFAYMARAKMQNACDAAVLAGRQSMDGFVWAAANETEARKFFDFNFPAGTLGTTSLVFDVLQDPADDAQVLGDAHAILPTSLMYIFGYTQIPVAVECNAKRDLGHNDVMLVLDVTGSMDNPPSIGGDKKIVRLRTGTLGLYRALADTSNNSITRFGIMPYSHTVNVARRLANRDIIADQYYSYGTWDWRECDTDGRYIWNCATTTLDNKSDAPYSGFRYDNKKYSYFTGFNYVGERLVNISGSSWASPGNTVNENRRDFRISGDGCIEERSSIGETVNPVVIRQSVSAEDIDSVAANGNDTAYQWGRYDPGVQEGQSQVGCPSEARKLQQYASETAFANAINAATAKVTGGTYHDIGMLWGARFISRTGMFSSENPTEVGIVPVNQHIVFMTDGKLDTGPTLYSAFGIDTYQNRLSGSGTQDEKHIARFNAICDLVKARGVTVWVIAFDVTDTDDIKNCATSTGHFYTTDGSDLEEIFEKIGRGIGNLRLTR